MGRVCIATDSTVQFSLPSFIGRQIVKILPYGIYLNGQAHEGAREIKSSDLPFYPPDQSHPRLLIPSSEEILHFFNSIEAENQFDQVLAIFSSASLSPLFDQVKNTVDVQNGRLRVQVI